MARIRTIKPDFWTDEKLTECSMSARLFFIGMWNFADDNGNLTRSAKKMKMQIFPAESCDCEELIQELMAIGVLVEYSVDGDKYMHIKGFTKHQVINRPSNSSIPKPLAIDDSLKTHGALTKGREGKGKEEEGKGIPPAAEYSPEFEIAWNGYPERPGANKKNAYKAWNARLKAGVDFTQITLGVDRYAHYCNVMKVEPQFIKQPETFFGPSEHYLSDWKPVAASAGVKNIGESLDEINARNNAEAKRLLFGTPSEMRTINA
ncbi:Hypothetical protein HEAR2292 [Herminiimonas arsenicoxydans]|uniref:Phage replication protein n=1 Tax=Herminiimonas arsenicoxydans TaxID=204773 RepID=A4G7D6_HERAR|nr:Hypothetical protein HEAR2292 [Herminiimonas arsenicoxydans]